MIRKNKMSEQIRLGSTDAAEPFSVFPLNLNLSSNAVLADNGGIYAPLFLSWIREIAEPYNPRVRDAVTWKRLVFLLESLTQLVGFKILEKCFTCCVSWQCVGSGRGWPVGSSCPRWWHSPGTAAGRGPTCALPAHRQSAHPALSAPDPGPGGATTIVYAQELQMRMFSSDN